MQISRAEHAGLSCLCAQAARRQLLAVLTIVRSVACCLVNWLPAFIVMIAPEPVVPPQGRDGNADVIKEQLVTQRGGS